ncbi:MAG: hypothetical protein JW959_13405 [Pirellulales bacterium]|nr:hypothetical protein [Pirellulales bacterium]
MENSLRNTPFFQELEAEHRKWLANFDSYYLSKWVDSLENDNEEAAFAEAGVRRLLQSYGVALKPNDRNGGPDYCCMKECRKFYVEVTCIKIETATAKTGIANDGTNEVMPFRSLNRAVCSKCSYKTEQCADLGAPVLLAIGTFHTGAGVLSFDERYTVGRLLTGDVVRTFPIDVWTGKQVGDDRCITKFNSAAFLRLDRSAEVELFRHTISGLLLCNLGLKIPTVSGVLHPNPNNGFDPAILPVVKFCQAVIDESAGSLRIEWPGEDGERKSVSLNNMPSP